MPRAKFWKYASTEEAYDDSQVNPMVRDGDVLLALPELVVGILVEAWPTAVTTNHGAFHQLAEGVTWRTIDGGKYAEARDRAEEALERAQEGA